MRGAGCEVRRAGMREASWPMANGRWHMVDGRVDHQPSAIRHQPSAMAVFRYFKCLLTSFVISNILTVALPPNTGLSMSSALIIRLFFLSCRPFFLM